jgi:hypothetical protein
MHFFFNKGVMVCDYKNISCGDRIGQRLDILFGVQPPEMKKNKAQRLAHRTQKCTVLVLLFFLLITPSPPRFTESTLKK